MLREWRAWQADEGQVEAIEAAETALCLRARLIEALRKARLFGGSVILVGDGSSAPGDELRPDSIRQGGIKFLHVLTRHEIVAGESNRDPLSPYFGEPVHYEVCAAPGGARQKLHPSRVIRFLGAPYPDNQSAPDAWSDSILQAILDAVDQATSAQTYVAAMLPEAKQDIIHVPGLSQHLSTAESTSRLTDRFAYAARMKSMFGMLLLEGDGKSPEGETYQQKQLSFASLPDVLRMFLQVAAGAADIPVTRLLGQSPAGLNSTGEGDLQNYYDHVGRISL